MPPKPVHGIGTDNTSVPEVISDYFGGSVLEHEDLGLFTLFSGLARVIKV